MKWLFETAGCLMLIGLLVVIGVIVFIAKMLGAF
jgi:hypothetical protein